MGLAIGVGVLGDFMVHDEEGAEWLRKRIRRMNEVLVENGLAEHNEPSEYLGFSRRSVTSYPYSFLHYLRRAYACVVEGKELRVGEMTDADSDFVQDVAITGMDSHLLSHSDAEGFYVPQSFHYPICDDRVPGSFLCSLPKLIEELERVAPTLGIHLENGRLLPAEEDELARVEDADPIFREKIVWFSLYEAAHICMKHGTLLVFH
jgi:hypothetical protein